MSGNCTPEEESLLESYMDDFELIDTPWTSELGDKKEIKQQILNKLHQKIDPKHSVRLNSRFWIAAASLFFVLSASLVIWKINKIPDHQLVKAGPKVIKNDILPGGNKATLTLADGSVINLDNSKKGTLSNKNNVAVNKVSDGQIAYNSTQLNNTADVPNYNIISTPRGGQYTIILADGTKVWLNAATTLKFPAVFTGNERRVELNGEAYFEVAKNKAKPFKVLVNNMTVEVLGTHFNVMGYSDDNATQTTLIEGSVKLTNGNNKAVLKPGEQGVLGKEQNEFDVQNVNTDDVVAWKNGYFTFKNEDIRVVMKKVSRWYDVDVVYHGELGKKSFGGSVSRFENVSELLKTIELTGAIHFKVEGRRISVMP
jgi:ferric-dicitrate binding protein FerR (iron transport regulator)